MHADIIQENSLTQRAVNRQRETMSSQASLTQTIFLSDVPATKKSCLSSSGWNLMQ